MVPKHSAYMMYGPWFTCSLHSEVVWVFHNLEDYLNWRAPQEPIMRFLGDILWAGIIPDPMVLFLVSMSKSQYKYLESLKMTWLSWWVCQPENLGCWSLMQIQMSLSLSRSIISLPCFLSVSLGLCGSLEIHWGLSEVCGIGLASESEHSSCLMCYFTGK